MTHLRGLAYIFFILGVCLCGGARGQGRSSGSTGAGMAHEFFVIMPWELPGEKQKQMSDAVHGVGSLRACGFNTAAFVTAEQVPLCEKAQMRAIVALPGPLVKWRELNDQQIIATVRTLVESTRSRKAVIGYFLADEPSARDFAALAKAVAAVKRLAPGKLAYINLFPNHATAGANDESQLGTQDYTEYLERFVNEVKPQFISYDNYQVQYSDDLRDPAQAQSYFANLLEIRSVAQKYELPFWNIVASNQLVEQHPIPSPASMSLQAFTTLAAGGRGLTWYTYYAGGYHYAPIDRAGNRTAAWAHLRMVNERVKTMSPLMMRLKSTGVYFTSPSPALGSAPTLPGEAIKSIAATTPVMIGEFSGSGDARFVMLVNLSLERSCRLTIETVTPAAEVRLISSVDGSAAALEPGRALWLSAGEGALVELR